MNTGPFRDRHVHLMGIGGTGVSALVPLLRQAGARVTGCDLAQDATVARLRDEGVAVALGHDPDHLADVQMVVHSSAVPPEHAELRAARQHGIEVLSRPACLAELMRGSRTVSVAGSHGKTTTAWMIGHLLIEAGADPVVMVGGSVPALGMSGGRIGGGSLFVAEVDESDGGFSHVEPDVAVITNLEAEHLRHYGSFAALCDAFHRWLAGIGPNGALIIPEQGLDPRVSANLPTPTITCGVERGDVHATELRLERDHSTCRIHAHGQDLGSVMIPYPGVHMVSNALMAVAAARQVAASVDLAALASCSPVRRRFSVHGEPRNIRVVEDYAHHPTELEATMAAARLAGGRLHVLFQPHRYTRTADCFQGFAKVLATADTVVVLPVYAAGEEPIPGVGGRDLAEATALRGHARDHVQYARRIDHAVAFLVAHAAPGDTCLVLGAGDVGSCCADLVAALEAAA